MRDTFVYALHVIVLILLYIIHVHAVNVITTCTYHASIYILTISSTFGSAPSDNNNFTISQCPPYAAETRALNSFYNKKIIL